MVVNFLTFMTKFVASILIIIGFIFIYPLFLIGAIFNFTIDYFRIVKHSFRKED